MTRVIEVNTDAHDYARDTRAARLLRWVCEPAIHALLKLSPRTAVVANIRVNAPGAPAALYFNGVQGVIVMNCTVCTGEPLA